MTDKEDPKELRVSTTPAVTGAKPVQPNPPLEPSPAIVMPPSLINPAMVGKGPFVGKHVVFCPVGNQLTQPMNSPEQAHEYARNLLKEGRPSVVFQVVAQYTP